MLIITKIIQSLWFLSKMSWCIPDFNQLMVSCYQKNRVLAFFGCDTQSSPPLHPKKRGTSSKPKIFVDQILTFVDLVLLKTFQNLSVSSPAPVTIASPSGDIACTMKERERVRTIVSIVIINKHWKRRRFFSFLNAAPVNIQETKELGFFFFWLSPSFPKLLPLSLKYYF